VRGNVGEVITEKDQRGQKEALLKDLDLEQVLDRNVENLSGGELQRFAIAVVAAQEGEWRLRSALGSVCVQQCVRAAVCALRCRLSALPALHVAACCQSRHCSPAHSFFSTLSCLQLMCT
jgi:hypothetical protein